MEKKILIGVAIFVFSFLLGFFAGAGWVREETYRGELYLYKGGALTWDRIDTEALKKGAD